MSQGQDLIKSSTSILTAQIINVAISLVFIAYFARIFSKEQMALYAILSILADWNEILGGLGLGTLVVKSVAEFNVNKNEIDRKKFVSSVLLYRVIGILCFSLVCYMGAPYITDIIFNKNQYESEIKYLILIAFVMSIASTIGHIQVSLEKFKSQAVISVATGVMQKVLCVIGYIYFGLYGFFTGHLVATLFGVLISFLDIKKFLTFNLFSFSHMITLSRGYIGLKLVRSLVDQIDRPIIASILGAEGLASYHVVKRLYDNIYQAILAVIVPLGVKYGEYKYFENKKLSEFFDKSIIITINMFIPLGVILLVLNRPLLAIYGGEKYVASSPILCAFGFTLIAASLWLLLREIALRLLTPIQLIVQYLVSAIFTISFYFLLLPTIGAAGIPISLGIGFFCGALPITYYLKNQWSLKFPIKKYLIAFGGGVIGLISSIVVVPFDDPFLKVIVGSFTVGSIAIIYMSKYGPFEIISYLKKLCFSLCCRS